MEVLPPPPPPPLQAAMKIENGMIQSLHDDMAEIPLRMHPSLGGFRFTISRYRLYASRRPLTS